MKKFALTIVALIALSSCTTDTDDNSMSSEQSYFPPVSGSNWETTSPESLNWDTQKLSELNTFLETNETRAFIILIDGKIVVEEYWNNDLLGQPFDATKRWYWASAGKSLMGTLVGIAQEENLLDINDKTSDYLGNGWTSMPQNKEDLITIKNQLTFTTGMEYNVPDADCTDPSCLTYKVDAGAQWYYHNATYSLLSSVIENASNTTIDSFTDTRLADKVGMDGFWFDNGSGFGKTYFSTARDAARFGLLTLNLGNWNGTTVLGNSNYYNDMLNSSQSLNPSYGYLWWLNGKNTAVFPGLPTLFPTSVTPSGPDDMVMALGKNGQFIDVIPSLNMVVIRMGNEPSGSLVPVTFHDEMWEKLNEVLP